MSGTSVLARRHLALVRPRDENWSGLVERIAHGDQPALAALYDDTATVVMGLAVRILNDRGAAEEVVGDVYLQVWRQASRFDPARGTALTWLLTLTRSRAIDRLRAASGRPTGTAPIEEAMAVAASGPGPEGSYAVDERRRLVRTAMASLTPEQCEAVDLAYYEGLSHSEIAERLGQPLGTVKTRIRLAMNHLRRTLGDTRSALT